MSRPAQKTITVQMVAEVAFRRAVGESVRSIGRALDLTDYYVNRIIKHPSFALLLNATRAEIAALKGGAA